MYVTLARAFSRNILILIQKRAFETAESTKLLRRVVTV